MKLHINQEQLNELSDKGKEKLREWWSPKVGDLCTNIEFIDDEPMSIVLDVSKDKRYKNKVFIHDLPNGDFEWYSNTDYNPLLSIGQMIEYLSDKTTLLSIEKSDRSENCSWLIYDHLDVLFTKDHTQINGSEYIEETELCDALWEAVKYDLEKI